MTAQRRTTTRPLWAGLLVGLTGAAMAGTGSPVWAGSPVQAGSPIAQVTQPTGPCGPSPTATFFKDAVPQPPVAKPDNKGRNDSTADDKASDASTLGENTSDDKRSDHFTLTAQVHTTHKFSSEWPAAKTLSYSAPGAETDYLGPTIVTRKNRPTDVKVIDALPSAGTEIFPFDQPNNDNKLTLHRHGGLQPAASDGAPAPIGVETSPGGSQTQHYPNNQAAAPLWYHDHIDAQTSYHAYEGLAGFMPNTDLLEPTFGLPSGSFAKAYVLQDKSFTQDKQLCYSHANPEFFGDTPVVNGVIAPKQSVEPRRYSFTFINGSDSRFYHLSLTQTSGPAASAPKMTVVASDSGYLRHPADVGQTGLLVAPGERYTVVVDFTGHNSQNWVLANDAAAPFPNADPTVATIPQLMRFDVGSSTSSKDRSRVPSTILETNNGPIADDLLKARLRTVQAGEVIPGAPQLGDKNQLLNYLDPATETPKLNSTEAWAMRNHSPDAHPIHLHLVEMRLIGRWPATFDANGKPTSIGTFQPPAPYETGPKETMVAPPGFITAWVTTFTVGGASVWHCHIMSHEDGANTGGAIEMMRPLVIGNTPQTQLPLVLNQGRLDQLIRQA
ncbi:multicopper oxidase domain-containing protein [Dactylosporangium sp. NPDC049140]|uniref:multicopper oxidase family protein n=1 Tax=Dactylosporangium sp. NPDC049140 TaxID=3155647 RepID=UPI0033D67541